MITKYKFLITLVITVAITTIIIHLKSLPHSNNPDFKLQNIPSNQTPDNSFLRNNIPQSNLFFHQVTTGTCASHGFDTIATRDVCAAAAKYYGFTFQHIIEQYDIDSDALPYGCSIRPRASFLSAQFNDLIVNHYQKNNFNSTETKSQCIAETPCFCTSKFFVERSHFDVHPRNTRASGQFLVTWDLSLGNQESLLESIFLRSAFEQSVKDFINNDILCSDNIDVKGAEFFGVELPDPTVDAAGKIKAVSGNGKCKGDLTKCQRPVKAKKSQDTGKGRDPDASRVVKAIHSADDFCDVFLSSTIFDSFKERLMLAATFNYNVDVDVINSLEGSLDLKYDVSFEPGTGSGLDQVDEVDMDPNDPVSIDPVCTESQCSTQSDVMRKIFVHFGIPVQQNKHECLYQGINCNEEDLVTHIWMVNYGFAGKTIPDFFGSLPSLVGLYLGGNQLQGPVPASFGLLRNLKLLWLENNLLTGTLPSKLGNLRGLVELNLHENRLSGTIPAELAKLRNLQMLNLGRNSFTGSMQSFYLEPTVVPPTVDDCQNFPNPFSSTLSFSPFSKVLRKIHFGGLRKSMSKEDEISPKLQTLILYENKLTGTVPNELTRLTNLVDLNLADNDLTGPLPLDIGKLNQLNVLDLHGNLFTGPIPENVGQLRQLKILNLYGNFFDGSIPNTVGNLFKLDELLLDNNALTGAIPSDIGLLSRLKYLTFSDNLMSGEVPSELGNLIRLENLDIRGYSITTQVGQKTVAGTIPKELGKLSNWKYVVFEGNGVGGSIPKEFGDLGSSEAMWMKNQKLTGELPSELAKLGSVSLLSMGNNELGGSIPTTLGQIGGLKQLDIGSNGIGGVIPTEMGNLNSLKYIGLGNANVTGTTPTEMGKLAALEYMVLANTKLTGNIPSEIGNLGNMKSFMLAGGNISGTIPSELGALTGMKILDFEDNGITGTIPSEIGNIEGLIRINLANNFIHGQVPSELGLLSNLEVFNLTSNWLTGAIPPNFGNLSSLQSLDFSQNNIGGVLPSELTQIPKISVIKLSENSLQGTIPTEFASLRFLVTFELANNMFSGTIPSELFTSGNVDTIEVLDFGGNAITGTIPTELGLLTSLTSLVFQNNSLSGTIPTELASLDVLEILNFGGNDLTGSIPSEVGQIETLQVLDLGRNNLTGTIPAEIGLLEDLIWLDLANNELVGLIPTEMENLQVEIILQQENNITGDNWFRCSERNYTVNNETDLDCLNLCGTIDEECSSLGVDDATCSDVGCNSGGKPGCTVTCRLDYSICAPGLDQQSVQLDLVTDHSGWQTSWKISGSDGVVLERPEDTYRNFDVIKEFHCLEKSCYSFTLFDSGHDGLCCRDDENGIEGSYSLLFDGVAVNASRFDSSISFESLLCTISPTSSPSNEPSLSPTSMPSQHPSSYPTAMPSQNPSFNPSMTPSIHPSLIPTQVPSIKPNFDLYDVDPNAQMFGTRVALSNDKVFVSNYHYGNGAVHVFDFMGQYIRTITASNGADGDEFGKDIAVSDLDIVVGAPNATGGEGSVYVFSLSSFTEKEILVASDHTSQGQQHFGEAVGASNFKFVVGAPNSDSNKGALYIFDAIALVEEKKVVAPESVGKANGLFGSKVILHNDRIFIGSIGYSNATGAVFKYDTNGNWMKKIEGSNVGDKFGHSMDASGSVLVIGAPGHDEDGLNSGKAYKYVLQNDDAILSEQIRPTDGNTGFNFGYSVSVSSSIMVTAPKIDRGGAGAVYLFDNDGNQVNMVTDPSGEIGDQYGYHAAFEFGVSVVGAPMHSAGNGIANGGIAYIVRTLL